jgi:hypothetical protein
MENTELTLEQRKRVYAQSAIAMNKRHLQQFRIETKDYFCKYEGELVDLIEKIPNWESYLTEKQLDTVKLYLSLRNSSDVGKQLGLSGGGAYNILFGTVKNNRVEGGVLKKLKNAYATLQKIEERKKIK